MDVLFLRPAYIGEPTDPTRAACVPSGYRAIKPDNNRFVLGLLKQNPLKEDRVTELLNRLQDDGFSINSSLQNPAFTGRFWERAFEESQSGLFQPVNQIANLRNEELDGRGQTNAIVQLASPIGFIVLNINEPIGAEHLAALRQYPTHAPSRG